MSLMSQWSQALDLPMSGGPAVTRIGRYLSAEGTPVQENTETYERGSLLPYSLHSQQIASVPPPTDVKGFTNQWLRRGTPYNERKTIKLLIKGVPTSMRDYAEHLYKVACLLYDGELTYDQTLKLERKYVALTALLPRYMPSEDPAQLKLYLVVEKCFDVFIKMAMNQKKMEVATHTIRFLTTVVMALNYWEIYNLLRFRPAIYQFLTLIHFDLNECYARFLREYQEYTHRQENIPQSTLRRVAAESGRKRRFSSKAITEGTFDPHDTDHVDSPTKEKHRRKRARADLKLQNHRVVPREYKHAASARSSNYDPDVVHECQLPSPEDSSKVCLRRFSRKYELIRHQETVHLKKKKLFKCYVCVKQDPVNGPRIFTRHDTLAKHIRVNHRISGKEAKAEVAYSKKHAEIVEEGDITVQVGRRKTKVDFELRAHMDKRGSAREGPDGTLIFDEIDESAPDSIHSGDEGLY
ncbi:hypothetical protein HF325_004461 [Metschnikowia pulcherrima]|uniref:C2H2-type domain-containing protein n=1 Tax=Metschnikowia pulcherrima TaxID=27326 RepID=A0A8H7LD37_9ASCO|nr:hypothetical protein HF325_004461 [Metschnikowia pulcherrima]